MGLPTALGAMARLVLGLLPLLLPSGLLLPLRPLPPPFPTVLAEDPALEPLSVDGPASAFPCDIRKPLL
ncbi:MAG: hypothetical protein ABWY00_10465 [Dongiaceae bacterium]